MLKPVGESKPNEDVDKDGNIFKLNLRFSGQYFDVETGKHYNINKDYDPVTGRHIQSGPSGFYGGINTYVYVGANPVVRLDETEEYWSLNIKNQRAFSFLTTVIRPTLYSISGKYNSTTAEQLLLGTAVYESENFAL